MPVTDSTPPGRPRHTLALVIGALLLVLCLATLPVTVPAAQVVYAFYEMMTKGGDGGYELTYENRSPEPVVMHFRGDTVTVPACAVRQGGFMMGPPYKAPQEIEVKDVSGNVLATLPLQGCTGHVCRATVRYPAADPGSCPADARREYRVDVENDLPEVVQVTVNGARLGTVGAGESARGLGPVPGDWATKRTFEVRDAQGKVLGEQEYRLEWEPMAYALDETPVLKLKVAKYVK